MSGISSGIGLISGIDTAALIEQLLAIEARPVRALQTRSQAIDTQRTALLSISAKVLALQEAATRFDEIGLFRQFAAASSNESVATATASSTATPGSRTFRVHSLVANHSVISRGLVSASQTPVGVGQVVIEVGKGRVNESTNLSALNGGSGVRRGVFTITDRSGAVADIDLTRAFTVDDVLEAINSNTTARVRARVTSVDANGAVGDRIVIEDLSGGAGNLIVTDKSGGFAANDLGIVSSVAGPRIDGRDLVRLSAFTPLSALNDGNGIGRQGLVSTEDDLVFTTTLGNFNVSLSDNLTDLTDLRALNGGNGVRLGVIRLSDRAGKSVEIDLADPGQTPVRTVGDVVQRINDAAQTAGLGVTATHVNSHLQLTDTTNAPAETAANFIVEDVGGSAAADLGIVANVAGTGIVGRNVYRVASVGDVINAINYAAGNVDFVRAGISADGNGITLATQGLGNSAGVTSGAGSTAAIDLGIDGATLVAGDPPFESRRLIAGLNTVLLQSLNGGRGIGAGSVTFTDRAGASATIDFTAATTLQDVIDLINTDPALALTASVNSAGNGIALRDDSGGAGPLIVADATGTVAADLGLAGTHDPALGAVVNGRSSQLQYIARQTLLAGLNEGQGVAPGDFQITDAAGAVHLITVPVNATTIGDVIDAINGQTGGAVTARINDTGDGILVQDQSTGTRTLAIEDVDGGQTAKGLRIAGSAKANQSFIDGTFEIRLDIGASDTLNSVAARLNAAGAPLSASVINDGSSINPFSLTITSTLSGRRGQLVVDEQGVNLGLETLTRAQDAILSLGGGTGNSLVIASSSNTVESAIPGVTINLLSAGDEEVTITVTQDVDAIAESLSTFVERYNDVQEEIDSATGFDQDSLRRGPLLGDPAVNRVRNGLQRVLSRAFAGGSPTLNRLSAIGIRQGANNRLEFDEARFRDVYEKTPELVEQLFTTGETGFGAVVQSAIDDLTRDFDGVFARKEDLLTDQQDLIGDRIDRLNVLLEAKRTRLERQFAGLESALAGLQDQQTSLTALAQLAATARG